MITLATSKFNDHLREIQYFMQLMLNRLAVGKVRHGEKGNFDASQDYLRRLEGAVEHYKRTGNTEFLVDAANYALLEFHNPLHPGAHFTCSDSKGSTV